MDLTLGANQLLLRDTTRRFLADRSPMSRVRAVMAEPDAWDREVYTALAIELDLIGVAVPTRFGGGGGGWRDLAVVCAELGSSLAVVPYLSTVLAAQAIVADADVQACAEYLPRLVAGEVIAAWCPSAEVRIVKNRLHGVIPLVPDGVAANLLVLIAADSGGPALFVVDGTAEGVTRRALRTLDPTRQIARVALNGAPARRLDGRGPTLIELPDRAAALLAAEQSGGLARCVQMATHHAASRQQFGQPIGAFQAVKHRLADLYTLQELAESTVRYATWAADEASAELPLAARVAKAYLSDSFCQVAVDTIHLLGGTGFTWEHDAHLYYKRARTSALLYGGTVEHQMRIADLLLPTDGGK